MEQKIDGLVALLAQSEDGRAPSRVKDGYQSSTSPFSNSPSVTINAHKQHLALSQPNVRRPNSIIEIPNQDYPPDPQRKGTSSPAVARDPLTDRDTPDDWPANQVESGHALATDLIDVEYAEQLLKEFRTMSDFFPFVLVPSNITVQAMKSRKPMLFLAILMTVSGRDRPLQTTLEERFRQELATKTIVKSHRSLDCLQSILVYLAWYQYHFSAQTQQINQLLHLAISMATDLGICHRRKKPVVDISVSENTQIPTMSPEVQREAQRAYLGCYYLSTGISGAMSRPNLLQYSPYMAECCKQLALANEFASDGLLTHMISLNHTGEDIQAAFQQEEEGPELFVEQVRVQMLLQSFKRQLKDWRSSVPQGAKQATMLDLSYNFYDMGLHLIGTHMLSSSCNTHSSPNTNIIGLLEILISCLEAGKAYLDTILSTPPSQYRYFSFIIWMRLPYVLLKTSKLCFHSDKFAAIHWDVSAAQDRLRLELCLESLCYRLQTLTTFNGISQTEPDFFSSIKVIMEHARHWYMQKKSAPVGVEAEDSPLEVIRDPYKGGRPTASNTPAQMTEVGEHAKTDVREMQENTETMFPAINSFADMDGLMDNFEDAFWTSNTFDTAMFSEL